MTTNENSAPDLHAVERDLLAALHFGGMLKTTEKLVRAALYGVQAVMARPAQVDERWRLAVDHELVSIGSTSESFADPRDAITSLIEWHVSVCLDLSESVPSRWCVTDPHEIDRVFHREKNAREWANKVGGVIFPLYAAPPKAPPAASGESRADALTDDQYEAVEWSAKQAGSYARPAEGETLMMKRERSLKELLARQARRHVLTNPRGDTLPAEPLSSPVEQPAAAPIYETYTGQNGWLQVSKEEYERTKDKYEHRIRYAQPAPAPADERAAFEAWMRDCEGYPYAGHYANLMWKAWQARAAYPKTTAKSNELGEPWWHALAIAADAVEKSADVWNGFGIQDAKVCVEAYLSAKGDSK